MTVLTSAFRKLKPEIFLLEGVNRGLNKLFARVVWGCSGESFGSKFSTPEYMNTLWDC